MHRALFVLAIALPAAALPVMALAGPYTDAGIPAADRRFIGWATGVSSLVRGPQDIANPSGPFATHGDATTPLGPPGDHLDTVSLGDGGSITVTFAAPIRNGPGADFAVFENTFESGLTGGFAELGFVDVSSDGVNFFRFAPVSLTQTATQVATFGTLDPTEIHNLAGKHTVDTGTPFDLAELASASALLDVGRVTHVRITDVVGSINPLHARLDSLGNVINDPYTTPFATGGFDLNAVGVINAVVPEPTLLSVLALAGLARRARK